MADRSRWGEPVGAWRALVACVLTIVLMAGARSSFAAFLRPIEGELGLDRATTSLAGTLTHIAYAFSLPVVGRLALRFGARRVMLVSVLLMAVGGFGVSTATQAWQILVFAGVMPGLGFAGATILPATVLLAGWFRRLGLAAGVASSALPAGQSIFVPLAVALIPIWGWRATYVLLGLLLGAVAVPALAWLAGDPPCSAQGRGSGDGPRPRAGLDVWLLSIGYFGCGFTDQFVTLHLVALTIESGVEPIVAGGLYSLLMAVGILGSVLSGPAADRLSARAMLCCLYGLRMLSLPLLLIGGPGPRLVALVVFAVLFGLTYIANQAPGTRLIRDRYGVRGVGTFGGMTGFAHQIGGAGGIAIGGLSVAELGGYGPAVLTCAAVALIASGLQLLIPPKPAVRPVLT